MATSRDRRAFFPTNFRWVSRTAGKLERIRPCTYRWYMVSLEGMRGSELEELEKYEPEESAMDHIMRRGPAMVGIWYGRAAHGPSRYQRGMGCTVRRLERRFRECRGSWRLNHAGTEPRQPPRDRIPTIIYGNPAVCLLEYA